MTADRIGRSAEGRAALWLRLKGWQILERRFRTPVGEIDLVARRGRVVAFVEVKARPTRDAGLEAVGAKQRRRWRRAADAWLARHPAQQQLTLRFDLIVIVPWRLPFHLQNVGDIY
ncbi:MAG TPA: YraN family protein [Geminicoccus sp.]|jgi:putative endonuclease|uniref:YraN family protein n=1 Tax=Geminicoccus sp. TaxID=2024832 RepID=UPI002E372AE8|nr:YraN family protein [Geminicoccus sp.]HEX2524963.1 YraN family protein [Geminicoccus sp.]